jgi:hypothetical protein
MNKSGLAPVYGPLGRRSSFAGAKPLKCSVDEHWPTTPARLWRAAKLLMILTLHGLHPYSGLRVGFSAGDCLKKSWSFSGFSLTKLWQIFSQDHEPPAPGWLTSRLPGFEGPYAGVLYLQPKNARAGHAWMTWHVARVQTIDHCRGRARFAARLFSYLARGAYTSGFGPARQQILLPAARLRCGHGSCRE